MTELLARASIRHPWRVIITWILCAVAAGFAALSGFGQGGLFSRMSSTQGLTTGTESARVLELTDSQGDYRMVAAIHGAANPQELTAAVADLSEEIAKIPGVASALSSPSLVREAEAEGATKAEEQARAEYQKAAAAAQQQLATQIEAATAQLMRAGMPREAAQARATQEVSAAAAAAQAGQPSEEEVIASAREEGIAQARTQASEETAGLRAADGFALVITFTSDAKSEATEAEVQQALDSFATAHSVQVDATSANAAMTAINDVARHDLVRGEAIGLPVALILMVLVFGGVLTALMPLAGAIVAIIITLGGIWLLTFVADVDSFVLNVVSIIGLALSIDYGLLVVSRYREEITRGIEKRYGPGARPEKKDLAVIMEGALATTVRTAGRTVIFSAVTIAFAIAGLLAFNSRIIRVIAMGGFVVVLLAVISAVSLVPALLRIAGPRLAQPSVLAKIPGLGHLMRAVGDTHTDHGVFSRIAGWVQRRPWVIMTVVTAILVVMIIPIKDTTLRTDTSEYIPVSSSPGTTQEILKRDYPDLSQPAITVLVKGDAAALREQSEWIAGLPAVSKVGESTKMDNGWHNLGVFVSGGDPTSAQASNTVRDIRAHAESAANTEILVGGSAAIQIDFNRVLREGAPIAFAVVLLAVLILLFLMTGSVLIPLKAIIINSLSLVASLGLTAFLFDNGLLGLPETDGLTAVVVACGLAFGFGLSMDYEVFLVARMKEYWDAGESNDRAVSLGLQRSGRIITSAAAIIVAVFVGFCFGQMLAIKEVGVLLAITVIADTSLSRILLVPATMTVLGKWNWWAPRWLSRIYQRFGVSEGGHRTLEHHEPATATKDSAPVTLPAGATTQNASTTDATASASTAASAPRGRHAAP
ncbi:MMPL family transporter [Actinotignum sp. GS-2025c]|uniref:MMPL family transporter n=1 Tax=Actinotignum sp. GS-2025c TaxID=3427276 RepID=UPI003F474728